MGHCKQHLIYVQATWFQELHYLYCLYTQPAPKLIPQNAYFLALDLTD